MPYRAPTSLRACLTLGAICSTQTRTSLHVIPGPRSGARDDIKGFKAVRPIKQDLNLDAEEHAERKSWARRRKTVLLDGFTSSSGPTGRGRCGLHETIEAQKRADGRVEGVALVWRHVEGMPRSVSKANAIEMGKSRGTLDQAHQGGQMLA